MTRMSHASFTRRTVWLAVGWLALGASLRTARCSASVVVLANRTAKPVSLVAIVDGRAPHNLTLEPGDSRPLMGDSSVRIRGAAESSPAEFPLEPDCAYYVGESASGPALEISKIPLGETSARRWGPLSPGAVELNNAGVVTVKILVDDDEPRLRAVWERELRERIAKASAILTLHCGVSLRIVAVGEWDSDDGQPDFSRSMDEFDREVSPATAQLAIGFSSQYAIEKGRVHLGGTRGPLHSHIILKERSRNVLETERLELLVHELGHVLGASHSPDGNSVMRPVITGGLQRVAGACAV